MKVLSEMFGPNREEVIKGWKRVHNEELFDLHWPSDTIRMSNCRRISWDCGVSITDGRVEKHKEDFGENTQNTGRNWKNLGQKERIVLKWI